jgi:hypothetical protein
MGCNRKRQVDLIHSYRRDYRRCLLLSSSRKAVSRALFQRELHLDYQRALHFIDLMTSRGYIEPGEDNALRRVKFSAADLDRIFEEHNLES